MAVNSIMALVRDQGLELPSPRIPQADFMPWQQCGRLLHISGQVCQWQGERRYLGKVGRDLTLEEGIRAAELSVLNILMWLAQAVDDDADRVIRCQRLGGFVNSVEPFDGQARVMGGASALMVRLFGDRGRHTRSSVGVSMLPFNFATMVEATFEVSPDADGRGAPMPGGSAL